ncbi:MAG: DoxX family protein [Blastocatellia bacterium]|nr:DoxX family protein [Blastocatellia bacterium]
MELEIERLGWKMSQMTGLGILEIAVTIIYLIPRTAVLGAILISAYLGAATATHVRIGDPFFMTIILGLLAWLGSGFAIRAYARSYLCGSKLNHRRILCRSTLMFIYCRSLKKMFQIQKDGDGGWKAI